MSQKRLREIVTAFASVGLLGLKERKHPYDEQTVPQKLRLAFEKLGPSFIKIGQILSTRSDLLPEVYIRELQHLQENVKPMRADECLPAIEAELGHPIDQVFADFEEEPLASASVAQTHRARLYSGEEVVIKIQRPNLAAQTAEDMRLLVKLSRRIPQSMIPAVNLPEVLEQLQVALKDEIDFRIEAQQMVDFARENQRVRCLGVPKVYEQFTTEHMIVEEYIDGLRINCYQELVEAGYDLEDIGQKLMLSFIKQVFKDGFFHGDPHPGNLIVHEGKIYFIDFGIVGRLEEGIRVSLNEILYSFTSQDVEGMTRAILAMTSADSQLNTVLLGKDVERMITKYGSLDLGTLSVVDFVEDLLSVFHAHHLQVPPEITILGKAALQIEGIFRELAPDVDLLTLAKKYFTENMRSDILRQTLNRDALLIELLYLLRNGKSVPRRINQLMEQVLNGRLLFNHDFVDFDSRARVFQQLGNRLVLAVLFLSLLLAGSLLSFNPAMRVLSNCLLILSGLVFIWLLVKLIHSEWREK